jgi:CBS domain-containing protein
MLVSEVMTEDVVGCPAESTLRAVVETMLRNRTGSVVVFSDGDPAGIVTETDVTYAGYQTDRPFSEIPTVEVMSSPLETVGADVTLRKATERMRAEQIKKLPVSEGLELVGIVTYTDIVHQFSEIKSEIHQMERRAFREGSSE